MTVRQDTTPMDQAYEFYQRITEKTSNPDVFNLLLSALQSTNQQVPFKILTRKDVTVLEANIQTDKVSKSPTASSSSPIIEQKSPNDLAELMKKKKRVKWEQLAPAYRATLISKIKVNYDLRPNILQEILEGNGLLRLIMADVNDEENTTLLALIVQDYLKEKINYCEEIESREEHHQEWSTIAMTSLFSDWNTKVFTNEGKLRNICKLGQLITSNLLLTYETNYKNVNGYVGQYYLAEFVLTCGIDLRDFGKQLLELRPIDLDLWGRFSQGFAFQYSLFVYFFDFHLAQVKNFKLKNLNSNYNLGLACISNNMTNILQSILPKVKVDQEMLLVALKYGNSKTIEIVLQGYKDKANIVSIKLDDSCLSPLHIIVERGYVGLTKKLLDDLGFGKILREEHMRNIMEICVENTINLSEKRIDEKCEIMSLLHGADNSLMNAKKVGDGRAPVHCGNMHLKILKQMVALGADIHSTDENGRNLVHYAGMFNSPEHFHEVIQYLVNSGEAESGLLKVKDKSGWTPLHQAVKYFDVLECTLELFKNAGVGMNEVNIHGETILHISARSGRSANFIKMLANRGADVNAKDKDGYPVWLHVEARYPYNQLEIKQALAALGGKPVPLQYKWKKLDEKKMQRLRE